MATDFDRIDTIYKGQMLAREGNKQSGAFGVMDLYRYLNEPDEQLTPTQMQALFGNPTLRKSFAALRARLSQRRLPMLAAASDDDAKSRQFPGGQLQLVSASDEKSVYLIVTFSDNPPTDTFILFLIEEADVVHKRSFPKPDANGRARLVLDSKNSKDAEFLRAFHAPRTTGDFVAAIKETTSSE